MRKFFKRVTCSVLIAGMCALSFAGCKDKKSSTVSENKGPSNGIETKDDGSVRKDLTAAEFTELMGNGINLGNTMEAYGHTSLGVNADVSEYEQLWGQPITTQEMVTGMHDAGFDSIRIPVAWTNMMDFENGDYTINTKLFDRVEEIVNYARNEGMYVIINDHWDGGWWGMFGSESQDTRDKAMEMYKSMWTQISERFKDYSDYVIFESGNEEIGFRLNDHDATFNADSGSLSEDECFETANKINQTFVDIVRGTGGNNAERFLLIAGYGTEINNTCDDRYVMPTDTADKKLIVSVHYYDPSGYCIFDSVKEWGSKTEMEAMTESLEKLTKFTDAGYGVIIGEYGVLIEKTNEVKAGTEEYYNYFLSTCDYYGYTPMLWDCNNLYNKESCKIIDDTIAKIYIDHSYAEQSKKTQEEIKSDAEKSIADLLANAKEELVIGDDTAMAWIMYTSSDWCTQYRVGDDYPNQMTDGVIATDVEVTGEGTYTVSLDFTQTQGKYGSGMTFAAVGILHGETLFPGYFIDIKEILVNGEPYELQGKPYTTADDDITTRVNLYNGWVSAIPEEARSIDGDTSDVTANIMNPEDLTKIETLSVTFDYVAGK